MIPHRCPICEGRSEMPGGFYGVSRRSTTDQRAEECRTCRGLGIVWPPARPKESGR